MYVIKLDLFRIYLENLRQGKKEFINIFINRVQMKKESDCTGKIAFPTIQAALPCLVPCTIDQAQRY